MPNASFLYPVVIFLSISLLVVFSAAEELDNGYPQPAIFDKTKRECEKRCTSVLGFCRFQDEGYVCEMDSTLLIVIIVMAVLTGVLFPVLCISLYVCGIFAYVSHRLNKVPDDEEMLNDDKRRRDRGSNDRTMETEIREKPMPAGVRVKDFSESSTGERFSDQDPQSVADSQRPKSYRSMSERPESERNLV